MDFDKARNFIKNNHRAVMATKHPDGRMQLTPVLVGLDSVNRPVVSTRETAYKIRNLREDPWLTLCIFEDKFFGEWIQIEGTAEIISLPEAMEYLVDYYRINFGEHPNWEEYRTAMKQEQRVLIRINMDWVGPYNKG